MGWCRIDLPNDPHLPERMQRLVEVFDALFAAAGYPRGMDLLVSRRKGSKLTVYMTPRAAHLAQELVREFRGRPCDCPQRDAVAVLDGFEADRRQLCR